ncbi:branched-chain amino acid ABC transporter permease [Halomarina halobia]|uniref:Branched-chain amino acid ABC transporter permease n=1 Tax=Halomarina halobia TaxID=3033386 RepID=A0ABD6AF47_9EURY|nr:branched-chain amino acid ABC transporter permease [Halomarina sp. PSR21]
MSLDLVFRPRKNDRRWAVVGLLLSVFVLGVPFIFNSYVSGLMFSILMFCILASSWNILSGYSGYISFGHAAFFGLGAYATALLVIRTGINPFLAILIAGVVTVIGSLPLATATLRLDDVQFSIVMLAFAEILLVASQTFEGLTEGVRGLALPIGDYALLVYVSMFLLCVVTVLTSYFISRSHIGLALRSIHDDEDAAEAMGVNTTRYKVLAFSVSAFFPGLTGGIAAIYWTYINPSTVFDPILSGEMMIMSVLGGMGTVAGPLIGATVLTPLGAETRAQFPFLHGLVFGGLFLLFVLTMPEGVVNRVINIRSKKQSATTRSLRKSSDPPETVSQEKIEVKGDE